MRHITAVLLVLALPSLMPADAVAGNHKFKAARGQGVGVGGCPPGLAKKNPPCVPPGQARKHGYRIGDFFDRQRYERLEDPWNYGLLGRGPYYRFGNEFIRVDPETFIVLEFLKMLDQALSAPRCREWGLVLSVTAPGGAWRSASGPLPARSGDGASIMANPGWPGLKPARLGRCSPEAS